MKLAPDAAIETKVAKDAVGTEQLQDDISINNLIVEQDLSVNDACFNNITIFNDLSCSGTYV